MEQTFGARLKAQREQRGISLEEISRETKIKATLLEALERNDVTYWPLGLFRRAYLRSYANMIGADAEAVVREFLELYPDPSEQAEDEQPQPTGIRRAMAILKARTLGTDTAARAAAPAAPARVTELPELAPGEGGFSAAVAQPSVVVAPEPARLELALAEVAEDDAFTPLAFTAQADTAPEPETSAFTTPVQENTPIHRGIAPPANVDLCAFAALCTRISRVADWDEMTLLLGDAADLLDAVGVTIWSWDGRLGVLHATWAHGYANEIVARMPRVRRDADNALADAWRDERTCIVAGDEHATGAVVIPMLSSSGCIGVLAIELAGRAEQDAVVRSLATILAAQLATLLGAAPLAEAATA